MLSRLSKINLQKNFFHGKVVQTFFFQNKMNNKIANWLKGISQEKAPQVKKNERVADQKFSGKRGPKRPHGGNKHFAMKPQAASTQASAQTAVQGSRQKNQKLRVIPLGGLNEVGKNCTVLETENDIIVIDAGLQFPTEDMLGVDFVIPDFTFLQSNKKKIRALIVTHGHLDHIGAVNHFLEKFPGVPVFSAPLTLGLIEKRLEEFSIKGNLNKIDPEKDVLKFGDFSVSFFRVNHTIPDGMGIFVQTPAGKLVHTGDFKFDFRSADGVQMDLGKIATIGKQKIDLLLSDSTNAKRPGFCVSESVVSKSLNSIFEKTKGRLLIATFSSSIGRLQQIANLAVRHGRQIFISGRSMVQNLEIAARLGHFKVPRGLVKRLGPKITDLPANKILILTTGSQGEPFSALSRIALGEHKQIAVQKGDTIVFSSSPIPGNERATATLINNLLRNGAQVIDNDAMDTHASGHGFSGDLKLMFSLVKPRHIVPIHGEFFMRVAHGQMLQHEFELQTNRAHILENGDILELSQGQVRKSKQKVPANLIMVDGLGVGDIGTRVIRDRQIMSENGVVIALFKAQEKSKRLVANPEVISRGFIFLKESREIAQETRQVARKAFENAVKGNPQISLKDLKWEIARPMQTAIAKKIGREPMIVPLIVFV